MGKSKTVELAGLDDARFMRRIVRRDVAAFEQLYDECSPIVFGHLLQRVPNPETAERLLVETFYRAWSQIRSFSGERHSLMPWLLGIAGGVVEDEVPVLHRSGVRAA